jgi:hypothetical protein
MTQKTETRPTDRKRPKPLPEATLRAIVGGAGLAQRHDMDPDKAVALTAGAEHAPTPPASVKTELAYNNLDFNGHFSMKLNVSSVATGQDKANATGFYVTGDKAKADSIKVTMEDSATKQRTELTGKDVSTRAAAGDERFKALEQQIAKTSGLVLKDFVKDTLKDMRGTPNAKSTGASAAGETKTYYEAKGKFVSKDNADGSTGKTWTTEKSSKDWTSRADEKNAGNVKTAVKEQAAAKDTLSAAQARMDKADARVTTIIKAGDGSPSSAAHGAAPAPGAKPQAGGHDAPAPKLASVAHGDAAPGGAPATSPGTVAPKPGGDHAAQPAIKPVIKAVADNAPAKPQAQAVDSRDVHKAVLKDAQAEKTEAGKNLANAKAAVEKADKAVRDVNTTAAANKALKDADTKALSNMVQDKGFGKTQSLVKDVLTSEARQLAKDNKTYHEDPHPVTLAGGGNVSTAVDGNVTTTTQTVARVGSEDTSVHYTSALGNGAGKTISITAEAGITKTTSVTGSDGTTQTTTNHAYAAAEAEVQGKASWTHNQASAEGSVKLGVHAEVSHTESIKVGKVEVKQTHSAQAAAETGAKAGASVGVDGVSIKARIYAEAAVKANQITEVTVGNVAVKNDLEVFAVARAEAKAEAEVNFNPLAKDGKVGAKAGIGAELTAGVGIQDTVGFKGKNGGGAEIGGGLYAGKLGAKADVDVGYSNGKVGVKFNVGAALGVGVSINVKVESNVKKAYSDAWDEVKQGQLTSVVSLIPAVAFVRGFFC